MSDQRLTLYGHLARQRRDAQAHARAAHVQGRGAEEAIWQALALRCLEEMWLIDMVEGAEPAPWDEEALRQARAERAPLRSPSLRLVAAVALLSALGGAALALAIASSV